MGTQIAVVCTRVCWLLCALSYCTSVAGQTVVESVITNMTVAHCGDPHPSVTVFAPTDAKVELFFRFDTAPNGVMSSTWFGPSGAKLDGGNWSNINQFTCFISDLSIAGTNAASQIGDWHVEVYLNGTTIVNLPFHIAPLQPRGPSPAYDGYFEPIDSDCSHFHGWARDNNSPNSTVNVDIAVDGFSRVTVPAGDARSDVGNHGWNLYNLQQFENGQSHNVNVYYGGTNQLVPGSPRAFPPANAQNACSPTGSTISTAIQWTKKPPSTFNTGDTFSVQWIVTGGSNADISHVHVSLRPDTVRDSPLAIVDEQSGRDGSYSGYITPNSYYTGPLSPGTVVYFVLHARDAAGTIAYWSDVAQSTSIDAMPPTGTTILFDPSKATRSTWLGSPQRNAIIDSSGTSHSYHAYTVGNKIDSGSFKLSLRPESSGSVLTVTMPSGGSPKDSTSGGILQAILPFGLFVNNIAGVNAEFTVPQGSQNASQNAFVCELKHLAELTITTAVTYFAGGGRAVFELFDVSCFESNASSILRSIDQEIQGAFSIPSAGDPCNVIYPIVDPRSAACLRDTNNGDSLFGDKILNTHQVRNALWKPSTSLSSSAVEFHLNQSTAEVLTLISQKGITIYLLSPMGDIFLDNYR